LILIFKNTWIWFVLGLLLLTGFVINNQNLLTESVDDSRTAVSEATSTVDIIKSAYTYQKASIKLPDVTIIVDIADTGEKRELGLSGRDGLALNHGMLFVFEHADKYGFWMRDMNFPIDMVWIDTDKRIVDITHSATPEAYPKVFYPSSQSLYVLELTSGFADAHNMKIGELLNF
jgi:hypothetical protein